MKVVLVIAVILGIIALFFIMKKFEADRSEIDLEKIKAQRALVDAQTQAEIECSKNWLCASNSHIEATTGGVAAFADMLKNLYGGGMFG